ncbi:MAG TPA: ATP-binding protein, partial [Candidatus Didemnitutus sp.]|nr:ATP-binding protein [Candidatus Didemnitutus sp.]
QAYTGQTWEEHRGLGWMRALHPDDRDRLLAEWERVEAQPRRFESRGRFWHAATRAWRHFVVKAAPLFHPDGTVRQWVGACTDTDNQIRAEQQLKVARDDALAANRAKDEFLAALSHELRTPLNPVLLIASECAGDPALPEPIRGHFKMIVDSVSLQARLIDDLLDLNRITRGKLTLDRRPLDLHDEIRAAAATVADDIVEKKITLTFELNADSPTVDADPVRLRQVFWNVLKNAAKFTSAEGRIAVSSENAEGDGVVVRVRDSGIGMSEDELARVFNPFVQGRHIEGAHHPTYGGLGLGLAISRMLIEGHGGRIDAESSGPGQGTTILIRLPRISPAKTGAEPSKRGAAKTERLPPVAREPSRRILFVEDHGPTRSAMTFLLDQRGHDVTVAESMQDALQQAEGQEFDVLISDFGLPDGDGCMLMAELRQRQPGLPGIAISGYGMETDLARSREAGFEQHLTKPVSIGDIERALRQLFATVRA